MPESPVSQSVCCRSCGAVATVAIRSGLEWHPSCAECAGYWAECRHGALSEVEPDYVYEPPLAELPLWGSGT
jgi:hypothetical protein